MKQILLMLQLLPTLIQAVKSVEEAIPVPKSGKEKLDLVLETIRSTGEDIGVLAPAIVKVVTKVVETFNSLDIFKRST